MNYMKYYRVQGGNGYSKSRDMLYVTENNTLEIPNILKKIHIGDEEHNKNFVKIRSNEKWKVSAGMESAGEEMCVIQMYFPEFFADLIRDYSIPEYISTDKNPKAPPHTVDVDQGEAYATYGAWNAIMQACCVCATSTMVKSPEEAEKLYEEEPKVVHPVDIIKFRNFLNQTKASSRMTDEEVMEYIDRAIKFNGELKKENCLYKEGNNGR